MSEQPLRDDGWEAYHRELFDPTVRVSAFVEWKRMSTGVLIARKLADARNWTLEAWRVLHGHGPSDWPVAHPPVVLVMREKAAHAACLGCLWFQDSVWDFHAAAAAARSHAREQGATAEALAALGPVPVVQRYGDDDPGVPHSVP